MENYCHTEVWKDESLFLLDVYIRRRSKQATAVAENQ